MEALRDPVEGPRERRRLERPDHQPGALLADVERRLGVAQHGQLAGQRLHLGHRVGHDVVVLQRHDGQARAGEAGDLRRPLARRDHHVARAHGALRRLDGPRVALAGQRLHRRVADDADAAAARAGGEGVGQGGRVDVAVGRQPGGRQHVLHVQQREQLERAGGVDDLHRHPRRRGHAGVVLELVEPVAVQAEAHGAGRVEVHGQAGVGLELGEPLDARAQRAHQAPGAAPLRAQAGGVPGRAAGQLVLLEQDDVGLAEPRQVVGERGAGRAAADDDDLGALREVAHAAGRSRAASTRSA